MILVKIKQPAVIAEVIAGILLGPTAFGRIPGFTDNIFPPKRMDKLSIVANIALILFLFLVGLEMDVSQMKKNLKKSIFISVSGMALPFGLGVAIAPFLLDNFLQSTQATLLSTALFVGVANSITSFTVLLRILTETKLINTPVGVITINAAAIDDATAWCFLALVIAIVGSKNLLNTIYILLLLVLFLLIMFLSTWFLVSRIKLSDKLNQNVIIVCLLVCFAASWITDLIGVHAIFGMSIAN